MSSQDVKQTISRVEQVLQRDWITTESFQNIKDGRLNQRKQFMILLLNFLTAIFAVRSIIGAVVDDDSVWQLYVVNPFIGFGIFSRLLSVVYSIGFPLCVFHGITIFWFERKGKLTPLTDLKVMFRKLEDPSQEEVKQFTHILRFIPYTSILGFLGVIVPACLVRAVGAAVTGYRFHGWIFAVYYCSVLFVFVFVGQYCINVLTYTHLIIAQSTSYFKIRLNRVDDDLKEFTRQTRDPPKELKGNRRASDKIQPEHNKQETTRVDLDRVVLDLQETLEELKEHNQLIKYFLRDELYGLAGIFIFFFVFMLGDHPWYFRVIPLTTVIFLAVISAVSFTNASQLYVRILFLAKSLHACQCVVVMNQGISQAKLRPRSAPSTSQGLRPPMSTSLLVLKCKFQVLRMIQRVSSPHLRIGYTVGNGDSFSDDTAAAFVSNIFGNTLMFLNAVQGQGF